MRHRDRVAEALSHSKPDRCPWQASFTPEFAGRLRGEMGSDGSLAHNRTEEVTPMTSRWASTRTS
jgi:hypothetical protein